MEELKNLLKEIGLPSVIISVGIIVAGILVFFIKRALDRREKQHTESRKTLREYARLQEEALLKAYRMLYEQVDLNKLSQSEFLQVVSKADDLIMEPFTRYRANLPDDIIAGIYNDIHSVLAQFKPYPAFPREVKPEAIDNLARYKNRFLKQIHSIGDVMRRYT